MAGVPLPRSIFKCNKTSVLCMGKLVLTYEKTHNEMCRLVDRSTDYVFWFAFYLDFDYHTKLKRAILSALERGVTVYISTSELNPDKISYSHPNLIVKNNTRIDKNDDILYNAFIAMITQDSLPKRVNHMRFLYNGHELLLGGTNSCMRYNGNHTERTCELDDDKFYWHDSGYLTCEYSNQYHFFHEIFMRIDDASIRDLSVGDLVVSNKAQYEFILQNIRDAKREIYIECQYFHTHPKHGNNQIASELAMRINRAVRNDDDFKITIIANSLNHDERKIHYAATCISLGCLCGFRKLCDCDDETFAKFVTCKMPSVSSHIIIHQKCWIYDDTIALYTTGNLSDRSCYDTGDLEMGIIIRKNVAGFRETFESNLMKLPLFTFDFTLPKYNSGVFILDNVQQTVDIWCDGCDFVSPVMDVGAILGFKASNFPPP